MWLNLDHAFGCTFNSSQGHPHHSPLRGRALCRRRRRVSACCRPLHMTENGVRAWLMGAACLLPAYCSPCPRPSVALSTLSCGQCRVWAPRCLKRFQPLATGRPGLAGQDRAYQEYPSLDHHNASDRVNFAVRWLGGLQLACGQVAWGTLRSCLLDGLNRTM